MTSDDSEGATPLLPLRGRSELRFRQVTALSELRFRQVTALSELRFRQVTASPYVAYRSRRYLRRSRRRAPSGEMRARFYLG